MVGAGGEKTAPAGGQDTVRPQRANKTWRTREGIVKEKDTAYHILWNTITESQNGRGWKGSL